jgi:hypothetical protein
MASLFMEHPLETDKMARSIAASGRLNPKECINRLSMCRRLWIKTPIGARMQTSAQDDPTLMRSWWIGSHFKLAAWQTFGRIH